MTSRRVLLINPPYTYEDSRIKTLSAHLGLLYLAATTGRENDVRFLDLNFEHDVHKEIAQFNPDFIGISAYSPQLPFAVELANRIKKRFPDLRMILGGIHATLDGKNILEKHSCFDYAIRGEGEFSFPKVIRGDSPQNIPGLVFRESGSVIDNGTTIIKDIDSLPFPARHLIDSDQYRDFPFHYLNHIHTSLMTSRGCPYHCIYCYDTPNKTYREHSPRYVLKEINHLLSQGINDFIITDDVFTMNSTRVESICNSILDQGLEVTWSCETRPDKVNADLLKLMKEAGCHLIYFGIESGNQQVLRKLGKGFSLDVVRSAVKNAKDAGIRVHGGFIFGFPFESKEQMQDTAEFSKNIGLDGAEFTIATPYPGTRLWGLTTNEDISDLKLLKKLNYTSTSGNPFWDQQELAGMYSQSIIGFYFRRKEFFKTIHHVLTEGTLKRRWELFKYLTFQGPSDKESGPDHDSLPTTPTIVEKFFKEQCQLCHGCDHTCKRRWFCYIQKIVNGWVYSGYRQGVKVIEWWDSIKRKDSNQGDNDYHDEK